MFRREDPRVAAIVAVLIAADEPVSREEIAGLSGVARSTTNIRVKELEEAELLVVTEKVMQTNAQRRLVKTHAPREELRYLVNEVPWLKDAVDLHEVALSMHLSDAEARRLAIRHLRSYLVLE